MPGEFVDSKQGHRQDRRLYEGELNLRSAGLLLISLDPAVGLSELGQTHVFGYVMWLGHRASGVIAIVDPTPNYISTMTMTGQSGRACGLRRKGVALGEAVQQSR